MVDVYFTCQKFGVYKIQLNEDGTVSQPPLSVFNKLRYYLGLDY